MFALEKMKELRSVNSASTLGYYQIEDKIKTESKQKKEINKIYFLMSSKKKSKSKAEGLIVLTFLSCV